MSAEEDSGEEYGCNLLLAEADVCIECHVFNSIEDQENTGESEGEQGQGNQIDLSAIENMPAAPECDQSDEGNAIHLYPSNEKRIRS